MYKSLYFLNNIGVKGLNWFRASPRPSHPFNEVHYTHQCKAKISYLNSFQTRGQAYTVWLHHFPIIWSPLCPYFLSHSWAAKSPMTLCCCAAVLFWENLGQLGWDAVSWGFSRCGSMWKRAQACTLHSTASCEEVVVCEEALACVENVRFGVSWRKCGSARGSEWAASTQSTFQKAAEPCDFSRLSQGLGYSVCLWDHAVAVSQRSCQALVQHFLSGLRTLSSGCDFSKLWIGRCQAEWFHPTSWRVMHILALVWFSCIMHSHLGHRVRSLTRSAIIIFGCL